MSKARGLALAVVVSASSVGCTLLSLDALQSSGAGGSSSSSGATGTTSATSSATASTTTGTTTTSSVTSSSTGGCVSFCVDKTTAESCADFDTPGHLLNDGWNERLDTGGGSTATIASTTTEAHSCASSARLELDGQTGGFSWIEVTHDMPLGTKQHATIVGSVFRTATPPASLGGDGLELEFDDGAKGCQVFVSLSDNPPQANFFAQAVDQNGVTQISDTGLTLPTATLGRWVTIEADVDWSLSPPVVTALVDGVMTSISLGAPCADEPADIRINFGIPYDDQVQSILVDDLMTTLH